VGPSPYIHSLRGLDIADRSVLLVDHAFNDPADALSWAIARVGFEAAFALQ
jgi:hypothetical protein